MILNANGIPLQVTLTGGNRNEVTQLLPLMESIPPICALRGRFRSRPREVFFDRGCDHDKYWRLLRARGILPFIARRGVAHGSGLGQHLRAVERSFAWLHAYKRLRTRWERRVDLQLGLFQLTCALICRRQLTASRGEFQDP